MLSSGNGRHRRPRQAPAAVVTVATAAATGVGIALPLIGAGSASAASNGTWDKVAICETGGQWGANTGNGFYGGLAITQDTWDTYGGDAFAKRPDLATRDQQIAVAEKILADLGPNAWPGCESDTGLLKDTGKPVIDITATPVPNPSGPTGIQPSPTATPTDPTGTGDPDATTPTTPPATPGTDDPTATATTPPATPGTTDPTGTPTGTPTTPGTQPTGPAGTASTPAGSGTPSTGSGRHAKPYDPTDEQLAANDRATRTEVWSTTGDTPGSEGQSGKNDSKGTSGATSGGMSNTGTKNADRYTVGSGDSLSGIASAEHVEGGWHRLYETNHQLIGDDPNLIKPGQILNLG